MTPFNHPLLIAAKKLAPCLTTGNVAVVKAPEAAPGAVVVLARLPVWKSNLQPDFNVRV